MLTPGIKAELELKESVNRKVLAVKMSPDKM